MKEDRKDEEGREEYKKKKTDGMITEKDEST